MKGDIKDRGRIKWTAMMLPEHTERLRDWYNEDELVPEPELTEWDLISLQEELEIAFKKKCETMITTWRKGREFTYHGKIKEIDTHLSLIVVEDPF